MKTEFDLQLAVERRVDGTSLEREFYTSPDVFDLDMRKVILPQWHFVGHESQLKGSGDYLLFDMGTESVIVIRDDADQICAHFNVCRHRGSRICTENKGHVSAGLRCPYHAWTYGLDGRLISATQMAEGFDRDANGLTPCPVRIWNGLVYVNILETPDTPDFESVTSQFDPFLAPHGLQNAKVAHHRRYVMDANWKLAVENFRECYHCGPSHPEYTLVNAYVLSGLPEYRKHLDEWEQRTIAMGHVTGLIRPEETRTNQPLVAWRLPIRDGYATHSEDGRPLAPLMGDLTDFDGGETFIAFNPLHYIYCANDHATVFRLRPQGPQRTEIDVFWLVDARAEQGADYHLENLIWMWDATTLQDVQIVNNNQLGVSSLAYCPGHYSIDEAGTADFVEWYVQQVRGRDIIT